MTLFFLSTHLWWFGECACFRKWRQSQCRPLLFCLSLLIVLWKKDRAVQLFDRLKERKVPLRGLGQVSLMKAGCWVCLHLCVLTLNTFAMGTVEVKLHKIPPHNILQWCLSLKMIRFDWVYSRSTTVKLESMWCPQFKYNCVCMSDKVATGSTGRNFFLSNYWSENRALSL